MSTTHDVVDIGAGEERQTGHRRSRRRRQAPVMGDTEGVRLSDSPLVRLVGGWRGAFDGALPPVVFVAVNAAAGLRAEPGLALRWAVASAAAVALALVTVRLVRRETLKQAVRGLVGLTVAAVFASLSGEARDFFRPGIYVDAAYAVLFAGSAVVGRPLVGLVHAALYRTGARWRQEPRLRRVFVAASWGWSLVYAVRAVVGSTFYRLDQAELLAVSKIVLGWPLTIGALVLTLAAVRRATASPYADTPREGVVPG